MCAYGAPSPDFTLMRVTFRRFPLHERIAGHLVEHHHIAERHVAFVADAEILVRVVEAQPRPSS